MSMDPRYPAIGDAPVDPAPPQPSHLLSAISPETTEPGARQIRVTPHLGHTLLFGLFVVLAGILSGIGFALSLKHIAHYVHETSQQMQTDPRVVIPLEGIMYAVAAAASLMVFPLLWGRTFSQGVHWRAAVVQRRWWLLAAIGVVTSIVVQVLSNFLPIPKELPIDKFFTNRIGVWLVAIFGVTVAPAFEELAFRGFLLPSLASAWDWVAQHGERRRLRNQQSALPPEWPPASAGYAPLQSAAEDHGVIAERFDYGNSTEHGDSVERPSTDRDPRWSAPALIFSTIITSIGFALLHGGQLAHSLAPLAVLFVVSLVLCITRLRFQSLAASTLVHSLYNATIFLMLFLGTDGFRHLEKLNK